MAIDDPVVGVDHPANQIARLRAVPPMASLGWNALRDRAAALVGASEGDFQELYREVGTLVQDCAKLAELLTDRSVDPRNGDASMHDPMICRGEDQGHPYPPCPACTQWAFQTLDQIAKIVGVELPEREELT